jgi:hypothetical protein
VRYHGHLPFEGEIVWLTPEQGGRVSGPPPTPLEQDYVATAFVPPHTAWSELASFVLRVDDRRAWRSRAFAGWLVVDNADDHAVAPSVLVVVTEGSRQVGFFRVDHVHTDPVPVALRALDLRSLVGCTEADARSRVEAAGGVFRTYDNEHPALTADYRSNRVTARIDDGTVAEVDGFS